MALVLNGSNDTITGLQINSANIVNGSITSADLASGAITSSALPSGSVIQYKSGIIQDINNRASTNSSVYATTGIHIDITPTNANNKIIIDGRIAQYHDNSGITHEFRIHNGTSLDSNQEQGIAAGQDNAWHMVNIHYEQIAGTTSEMTFTLYHAATAGSGTAYVGWTSAGGGSTTYYNWQYFNAIEVVV